MEDGLERVSDEDRPGALAVNQLRKQGGLSSGNCCGDTENPSHLSRSEEAETKKTL